MPDWLSWGNVSSCRLLRCHVFRGSDMIGQRSAGAADGVALCLAHIYNIATCSRSDMIGQSRGVAWIFEVVRRILIVCD